MHFNLLGKRIFWNPDVLLTSMQDGALYVDDKTFGKLPDVYTEYRRVFGDSVRFFIVQIRDRILIYFLYVLQATSSTMFGMHYAAKSEISTWEVRMA